MAISTIDSTGLSAGAVLQPNVGNGVAGTGPVFCAYANAQQTGISVGTFTQIALQTIEYDTASCFNNTNATVNGIPAYAFKPNVAGYYSITGIVWTTVSGNNLSYTFANIYKNGAWYKDGSAGNNAGGTTATAELSSIAQCTVYLNGTTDYVQLYVWGNTNSSVTF